MLLRPVDLVREDADKVEVKVVAVGTVTLLTLSVTREDIRSGKAWGGQHGGGDGAVVTDRRGRKTRRQ